MCMLLIVEQETLGSTNFLKSLGHEHPGSLGGGKLNNHNIRPTSGADHKQNNRASEGQNDLIQTISSRPQINMAGNSNILIIVVHGCFRIAQGTAFLRLLVQLKRPVVCPRFLIKWLRRFVMRQVNPAIVTHRIDLSSASLSTPINDLVSPS